MRKALRKDLVVPFLYLLLHIITYSIGQILLCNFQLANMGSHGCDMIVLPRHVQSSSV